MFHSLCINSQRSFYLSYTRDVAQYRHGALGSRFFVIVVMCSRSLLYFLVWCCIIYERDALAVIRLLLNNCSLTVGLASPPKYCDGIVNENARCSC